MSEAAETIQRFQSGLEPYIRPREQANYIRRIIALHLKSSADAPLSQPLALAGVSDHDVAPAESGIGSGGIHGEYMDALRANVAARRQFESLMQTRPETPTNQPGNDEDEEETSFLDEQLAILRLQKKRQKLSAVRKYLDQLVDQPAASPDYLDAGHIFDGTRARPAVPAEVMDSLVAESSAAPGGVDIGAQANQLEKTVLRAKLQLVQEEKLLAEAKARSRGRPSMVSNAAKLDALQATRAELVGWIEQELSSAPAEEDAPSSTDRHRRDPAADQAAMTRGLADIKEKYAEYLESRRELLALISADPSDLLQNKPVLKPPVPAQHPTESAGAAPPTNYLLIPYLERLLALSTTQRALIAQKSHTKAVLARQTRDTCEALGHLAEESQLLPAYPMKESLKRRSGLMHELVSSSRAGVPDLATRIKPWVFASDSAKIAGLESVTETVEGGQLALEASEEVLRELEDLAGVGRPRGHEDQEDTAADETAGDDVWLEAGEAKGSPVRKHSGRPRVPERKPGDPWSVLHGSLGLIGQEDAV